jgi:translation elongation factor P/translation initiation factor 5A
MNTAADIKKGDKIIIAGAPRTVTHVRKSRQYKGFYAVQFANDPLPSGSYSVDLKWNEIVTSAIP